MKMMPMESPYPNLANLDEIVLENPEHIWIELTDRCNARCRHCAHYTADFGSDMPDDVFQKITDSVLKDAGDVAMIGFGEPLISRHFDKMLDACLSQNIKVSFTTNGILLGNDQLVSRLVRENVFITLSIEGASPENHEFIRPSVKWQTMLNALECLKRNADKAGTQKRSQLRFNFVAIKQNIADLPDIVRLAKKYGAASIMIHTLLIRDNFSPEMAAQALNDSPELIAGPLLKAYNLASKYKIKLIVPPSFRDIMLGRANSPGLGRWLSGQYRKAMLTFDYLRIRGWKKIFEKMFYGFGPKSKTGKRYCIFPWENAFFGVDGSVLPCCMTREKWGDLNQQDWAEIWNGPLYRNLRRTIHGWNPSYICRHCGLHVGVNGGDDQLYSKYFSKFQMHNVSLDSRDVEFGEGFYPLEGEGGDVPSPHWMGRKGVLILSRPARAKFIRFGIIPREPIHDINPGRCRINGGPWEPFDNTCEEIHIPIHDVQESRRIVEFEMENATVTNSGAREFGLGISGIAFLD